jgi:GNAT superfamily N-acetyltransferase
MKLKSATYEIDLDGGYLARCRIDARSDGYISRVRAVLFSSEMERAGSFEGEIIHLLAIADDGYSLALTCDGYSGDLLDVYVNVLDEDKPLYHESHQGDEGDLFYCHFLRTYPAHRGHDLGLKLLAALLAMISDWCGIIVMKPQPLQWRNKEQRARPENVTSAQMAAQKLLKHYQPLDFSYSADGDGHGYCKANPGTTFLGFHRNDWRLVKKVRLPNTQKQDAACDLHDREVAGVKEDGDRGV